MKLFRKLTASILAVAVIASQTLLPVSSYYVDPDTIPEEIVDPAVTTADSENAIEEDDPLDILYNSSVADSVSRKTEELKNNLGVQPVFTILTEEEAQYIEAAYRQDVIDSYGSYVEIEADVDAKSVYATDYFYNQMSSKQKEFYDNLYELCVKFAAGDVSLYKSEYIGTGAKCDYNTLDESGVTQVLNLFYYSNPQFFFMSNGWAGTISGSGVGTIYPLISGNFTDASTRNSYKNQINSITTSWMKDINAASTPLEKQKVIYTKLADNIVYTYREDGAINDQTIAGALVDGKCVCNGYALANEYLLNAAGINCITVVSTTHAWNIVNLYGNWYEEDVTWMDQGTFIWYDWLNKSHKTFTTQDNEGDHNYELSRYTGFTLPSCTSDTVDEGSGGSDPVTPATVTSIEVKTLPDKTTYSIGESLDLTGGTVLVKYSDGTTSTISMSECTATGFKSTKAGTVTVTLKYNSKTTTFTVEIVAAAPVVTEKNVELYIGKNGVYDTYKYFADVNSTFAYIDSLAAKTNEYRIETLEPVSEDTLNFPTYAQKITLVCFEPLTVNTTTLAPKTSLSLSGTIANKNGKALNFTVAANSTLTVCGDATIKIDKITGKTTSNIEIINVNDSIAVGTIATCKGLRCYNVNITGKVSGVKTLCGTIKFSGYKTTNSVAITDSIVNDPDLGDTAITLTMGKVSGKDAVTPLTVKQLKDPITITVVDSTGKTAALEPGLKLLTVGSTTNYEDKITLTNTDSKGNELKVKQEGKNLIVASANEEAEENVYIYNSNMEQISYASDLNSAFAYIDALGNKKETYYIELVKDLTEDSLTFPKNAKKIVLFGGFNTLTVVNNKLLPQTDLLIDTIIKNSKNKAFDITMPAKTTLSISGLAEISLGKLTGKSTADLIIYGDEDSLRTVDSIATFNNVIFEGPVAVTSKVTGVKTLSGTVKMTGYKTSNTLKVTNIDDAHIYLTLGKISGKDAVAPVTVNKILADLELSVVDAKGNLLTLEPGLIVAKAGTTADITDNIIIENTDKNGDTFSLKQDEKKNITLASGTVVIEPNVQITGSDGFSTYANDLSMAFEMIDAHANKKAAYTVDMLVDITEDTLTFPANAAAITLTGEGKLTLGAKLIKLLPKTSLTIDASIVNEKKKAIAFTMPAKTVLTIAADAEISLGALTGKSTSDLYLYNKDQNTAREVTSISTFNNVYIDGTKVTGKVSGVKNLIGTLYITGYKSSNSITVTTVENAIIVLTMGKSGQNNIISPLKVNKIKNGLILFVVDNKGNEVTLEEGTVIAKAGTTTDISGLINILNNDADGNYLSVTQSGKDLILEKASENYTVDTVDTAFIADHISK